MTPRTLHRRYGHAGRVKYPQRETTGATAADTFGAAATAIGSMSAPHVFDVDHLIAREDVERAIANWEQAVSDQLGRKIRFTHWREYTPSGHWRYVSINRAVDALAVVEEGTYGAAVLVNRARFGFRAASWSRAEDLHVASSGRGRSA